MKKISSIRALATVLLGALVFSLCPATIRSQTPESPTQSLLDRAQTFETRGRVDMAAQIWQQVLLVDPNNTEAIAGLARSAKLSGNPALATIYLNRLKAINPNDPNIARIQSGAPPVNQTTSRPQAATYSAQNPAVRTQPNAPHPSQTQQEHAAYNALNEKNLLEAEQRFQAILTKDPQNPSALAGMGYVRLQQSDFGEAIRLLEQAKQSGARDSTLDSALESAHFYQAMNQGSNALNQNDLTTAEQQYRAALAIRQSSSEALEGLGSTLLKAQQPQAAIALFQRNIAVKPSSPAAWRGLFLAQYGAGYVTDALQTDRSMPPTVHTQLMRDPDYLRALASAYSTAGRDADAQRILQTALDLPFPAGARGLQTETQLQYASLLLQTNRLVQAAGLYKQILATDHANTAAWQGLIRVQHAMKEDRQALQSLQAIPPSAYEAAMRDSGFQVTVASIYQSQNKLDIAQDILEKTLAQQTVAGQKPSTAMQLELADICLARNDTQRAFTIYRAVLSENNNRPDAWSGLLATLHVSGRNQEALAQIQQIPLPVRQQLENDVNYLQTVGAIYTSLNQPREALVFINRLKQRYAAERTAAPAEIDIQDAWLLFNSGSDAGLYRQLMLLGGRQDLTDEQRRSVQIVWTNWAVRSANQSAANGDPKRSLAILNAAALAFPDNPGVLRALASGYAHTGLPKQAVLIFKSQDMTAATISDYKAAVSAALAAGDVKIAESWLRYGLEQYPKDAAILTLAAKFEQARGNSTRAADYYRASLAALPPRDPAAELAAELSQPQPVIRLPSPNHPQDLATLLSTVDPTVPPYPPSYTNPDSETLLLTQGNANVVPPYMANPPQPGSATGTTLGNYTPDAAPQISTSSPPPATRPQQDAFGPYVPYMPPQTGNNAPSPEPGPDTLRSASYVPNARTGRSMEGQSNSPTDNAPSKQTTRYASQQQHSQPSGGRYGQQYTQPRPTPRTAITPTPQPPASEPAISPSEPLTLLQLNYPSATQPLNPSGHSTTSAPATPPTDAALVAKNLPPLRGSYDPNAPVALTPLLSQRQKVEFDLSALEASYSGWIGGTGNARYRSGTPGLDRLTDVESPFEASAVLGKTVRATVVALPVFLNSGTIDTASFQNSLPSIPILGTLPANAPVTPPQQFVNGIGGELQLSTPNISLAAGYTPYEFLVANITGSAKWRPAGGPVTLFGNRDSVKDTQLSYAGLRDPGSATPTFPGNIWGGVISTGGGIRLDFGSTKSNFYISGDAANLTGFHVLENRKYEGQMGARFQVIHWPGHGNLNIGANFAGMHYQYNERGMTYGQGGYFSPNFYFRAVVPITYNGYYKTVFHYTIIGGVGVQTFQQDKAPFYPLDPSLQLASGNAQTPTTSNTSLNYEFSTEEAYRASNHMYLGAFLSASNTNNYNDVSGGFFLRYLFKTQFPTDDYPTGLFPLTGFRPLRIP